MKRRFSKFSLSHELSKLKLLRNELPKLKLLSHELTKLKSLAMEQKIWTACKQSASIFFTVIIQYQLVVMLFQLLYNVYIYMTAVLNIN